MVSISGEAEKYIRVGLEQVRIAEENGDVHIG
jgi:hypothetical protein